MEYSNLFVVLMGICTVFIGLICIIVIVSIMGAICRKLVKPTPQAQAMPATVPQQGTTPEMIAAVAAAIAEDMGTDISAIRITSIKKICGGKKDEKVQSQRKRHCLRGRVRGYYRQRSCRCPRGRTCCTCCTCRSCRRR